MRGRAEAGRQLAVREDAHESGDERVLVGAGNQDPLDTVGDEIEDAAGSGRDDSAASCERLDHDPAETLRPGGEHEQGGVVEGRGNLGRAQSRMVLDLARKVAQELVDDVLATALADDHEAGFRQLGCDPAPGRCQAVDVLVRLEHADEERHRRSGSGATGCSTKAERSL